MRRRAYLQVIGATATIGAAGCVDDDSDAGTSDGSDTETSDDSDAGTSDDSDTETTDNFDYETTTTDGVEVPLVPLEDAHDWYEDDEAVFVDTRSETAFEQSRIEEAVLSPAPDGQESNDPVEELSTDRRIVTYCGCPHHLATLRGAALIEAGYSNTYAIDEGFHAWQDAGYPLAGTDASERLDLFSIDGRTDPTHASELTWAWHEPSGQREAAPIAEDGAFTLHIRFHDVDPDSQIRLETPAGSMTRPLETLAEQQIEL